MSGTATHTTDATGDSMPHSTVLEVDDTTRLGQRPVRRDIVTYTVVYESRRTACNLAPDA